MKKTGKMTLSAILAALASVFMITSFFPYLTYGIPALANCAVLLVNTHRGLFFVVGRSQRCEAPARPVYVFQYMWHPRRVVRLCFIVLDPHPMGVVGGGVSLYTGVIFDFGHFDKLSDRI